MTNKKRLMYCLLVGIILGNIVFWTNRCQKTEVVRVERDTIVVYDTIPHYYPKPVESVKTKTEYRWLTRVVTENVSHGNNSVDSVKNSVSFPHDSVLVEVPIESKHYHEAEFDAWVSGYEPSLDSIKVYQKTEYITERITVSKPPNKWELDAMAGIDYNTAAQRYTPYAGGELLYKPSRLQLGIRGGVIKNDKFEPVIGATIRYKVF